MGGKGSGRRPKPLETLKITGQYRQDRHGQREIEDSATGKPIRPQWLSGEARKFWDRTVPLLVQMGIAKQIDSADLASMCQWWAVWREHITQAAEDPASLTAAVKAWSQFAPLADRFGMSPSARTKIAVPVAGKQDDPATKYFA